MIVLGPKLENPYSVDNMDKAVRKLIVTTRTDLSEAGTEYPMVATTHFYVKFKPKTQEELSLLKTDSTLILYEYPLDREILEGGTYYHDPSIPDSLPTYQYASVSIDQMGAISDLQIEYDLVEQLFIPDEESNDENDNPYVFYLRNGQLLDQATIAQLVDTSLEMTGNTEAAVEGIPLGETRASKWRPAGRFTYLDEVTNQWIGMRGIRVRARRWFTTHTGIVDGNGYYSCDGTFKRPANYSFDFERSHFEVMNGNFLKCHIDGPKKTGNWDYSFSRQKNALQYFFATVFRAAFHYCYQDIEHLNRPPQANFLRAKIRIQCINKNNDKLNGRFEYGTFIISKKSIEIYNPTNRCDVIYATTIHELAHSAHWRQDRNFYTDKVDKIVKESWATGVEVYLTRKIYPRYSRNYNRVAYTGIVEDLMDEIGLKKSSTYYDWETHLSKSYTDNTTDYSIKDIENALTNANSFDKWKNNLKSKYPNNATKNNLDTAFSFWSSR